MTDEKGGAKRANHPKITLRKARDDTEDCRVFFKSRNDPTSRRFSRQTEPIDYASHKSWYAQATRDSSRHLFVVESDGVSIGYCRVEGPENEISIAILPGFRGIGIGSDVLNIILTMFPRKELKAVIRADNAPSKSAFAKAGFRKVRADRGWETWVGGSVTLPPS